MSRRLSIIVPVAVFALAPVFGVAGVVAPAQAGLPTYTCTAQTWAGEQLPAVTVEAKKGKRQAAGVAQTEWRGTAKFATIVCTPN
ncbi:hypothetical protein [Nocardia jejuensis]|uniref:hypothetical protein n=1 Tax=Nocardia jejuensis TaxID=328049 RepID=UPI000A9479EE|nr:hypothetical protein [Nocardia jejuensis]